MTFVAIGTLRVRLDSLIMYIFFRELETTYEDERKNGRQLAEKLSK